MPAGEPAKDADRSAASTDEPPFAGGACAPLGPDGELINWDWPGKLIKFPDDVPLHALLLSASRLLGARTKTVPFTRRSLPDQVPDPRQPAWHPVSSCHPGRSRTAVTCAARVFAGWPDSAMLCSG